MPPTLFIAYPEEFNCKSKFDRKVNNLTKNIASFDVIYISDPQGLVSNFVENNEKVVSSRIVVAVDELETIDYGIVFSDDEIFTTLINSLERKNAKIRIIDTPITHVVNLDKGDAYDEYIGRGTPWGNPFALGIDGDRDEVIKTYAYHCARGWLKFTNEDLIKLRGKKLGCHCKPAACHGDVLAKYLNEYDDGI